MPRGELIVPGRPSLMGVLNVTPDSFSDGGKYYETSAAVERGRELVRQGADSLDIGGESTRPGAEPVDEAEELRRTVPVIEALAADGDVALSIDTTKAEVARRAVEAGARVVNDISGAEADPEMLATVAELRERFDLWLVLMHRQGDPKSMQVDPSYDDPVDEVKHYLAARVEAAEHAGIPRERVVLDPGLGFGKRLPHNLALFTRLGELKALGHPLLVGASRKSFIGHITGAESEGLWRPADLGYRSDAPADRIGGTAAAVVSAALAGADVLRVHDVAVMREAVMVALAIDGAR